MLYGVYTEEIKMNITIFTGWIAAVLLFFNFATCLAMPWANKKFSDCSEKDCKNRGECHAILMCKYHKPIVILSVIAIIVHIVASILT